MPSKKLFSLTRTTTSSSPHLRCFVTQSVTQSVTHNKNDSHMYLRGNAWYFRLRVPSRLRSVFKISVIRQSLGTTSKKEGKLLGLELYVKYQKLFRDLDKDYSDKEPRMPRKTKSGLQTFGLVTLSMPDGTTLTVDQDTPEQEAETASKIVASMPVTSAVPVISTSATPVIVPSVTIAEALESYYKERSAEWNTKTATGNRAALSMLMEVLEALELPFKLSVPQAQSVRDLLKRLPRNRLVFVEFKGMSLKDQLKVTQQNPDKFPVVTDTTVNANLTKIRSFYEYCTAMGWIGINPFKTVKIKDRKKVSDDRAILTDAELTLILSSFEPKKDYQSWIIQLGISKQELLAAHSVTNYQEPIYQLVSRCSLRSTGSTQKCIIVVPDRKAADYIAKILGKDESCISEPVFKVKSVNSSPKASKKPMFQRGFMMSAQEKMWFKTWRGRRSTKLDPYTDEDRVIVQDALRTYRLERVADSYYREPEWTPDA